jgi:CHAT domain-containing protein
MNLSKIYLSSLGLIILTIAPASARLEPNSHTPITISSTSSLLNIAQTLNQQGAEFLAAGKADRALGTWEQAHKIYTQIKDTEGEIGTKINQAQALQSLGFYRQALVTLQAVNTSLDKQPESALKMRGLLALGNSLRVLRILEQRKTEDGKGVTLGSKETLERALAIATKLQDRNAIDRINLSLGNTLSLFGTGQEQAAIDVYEKIGVDAEPITRVKARINLYRLQSGLNTAPNTLTFLTEIGQLLEPIPASRSTIFAYINLADTIKKNQETRGTNPEVMTQVAKFLGKAIGQARNIQDRRSEAQALGVLGSLYQLSGQYREAKNLTQQALQIAESLPAPDLSYRLHWQLGKTIAANNPKEREVEVAITAYAQAINHLKSLRNDLNAIDADLQFSFRDSVEPVYREYVNLLLRDEQKVSVVKLGKARDLIELLQVAELENFLRQGCLDTYTVPLDQIDRTAAVIYPIILPDRVATIASFPGQPLRYHSQKISAETIEESISKLREKIIAPNFTAQTERELKSGAKQIHDLLLAPFTTDLDRAKTKTLVFVLDGAFRSIPMSVLYDGNQYLVEKYSLALTPGLQLVPPQDGNDRLKSQALLGGISEGRQGFAALPNVKPEIDSIGRLIPHQKLFNQQFNTNLVSTNLVSNSAPIVHFATHGQFSSKAEDTFILTWDKRLDLDRLSNLLKDRNTRSSSAIELLVLSACQTAAGDNRATLGLAGVAIRARAKSTIASLWSVNDESTQDLMINLYRNLATKNLSKGEALRQAQQALLRDPKYRSPYYWAPFVLVGNWQ